MPRAIIPLILRLPAPVAGEEGSLRMSGLPISRRGLLAGSALLLASTALPAIGRAQTPKKGGRLIVA
ncbi:MAG: hypothetical protein E5X90_12495, partial [Mesorhizobium sp.]